MDLVKKKISYEFKVCDGGDVINFPPLSLYDDNDLEYNDYDYYQLL